MFFSGLFALISKLLFFTGRIEIKNAFEKPLSSKDEKKFFTEMKEGNKAAEEILIKHNLRLVAHIAKKYKNSNFEIEDLISIGSIGLMKAIKTFSYEKGNSFSTYASRCIENEILMTFRSDKKNANAVYLEDVISVDKDGNNLSLYEVINDNAPPIESQVENKILYKKIEKIILNHLSTREKEIIIKRYGLCNETPRTQNELADELNISRSYISRLEKKALETIKNKCNLNNMYWFLRFSKNRIIIYYDYFITQWITTIIDFFDVLIYNIYSWLGNRALWWGKSEHRRAITLDNVKPGWPEEECNRNIQPTGNGEKVR